MIRENHQFLWESSDAPDTWEKQLAKKYYDKLFKEYCICDLSHYKENKVKQSSPGDKYDISELGLKADLNIDKPVLVLYSLDLH